MIPNTLWRKLMKKTLISAVLALFTVTSAHAIKLTFSYFVPFGGNFSTPVAPVGFDDLGVTFGDYFGISTGLNLYNIGGMNVKGIPNFSMSAAGTTSFLSLNIPLYLKIILPMNVVKIELKGGGFAFYNFGLALNKDFDAALARAYGYDTLVSSFRTDNNIGFGWRAGGDITVYVTKNIGIMIGANYLSGASTLNIQGQYTATRGTTVIPGTVNYSQAYVDYTGLTLTIGGEYLF